MTSRVLITGGAGFIGSHVADLLLARGYRVRVLDNLAPQVHGPSARRPPYLAQDAELVIGDIRNSDTVATALRDIDAVIHLAASVGVGQSMYDIASYVSINEGGTAVLLEALIRRPVEHLVVASSMSVYGEGLARNEAGVLVSPEERSLEQLQRGRWELETAAGERLAPVPTPESKEPALSSIYALNKYAQERLCLIAGRAYAIPTVALRFFNVFGPRQALSNPYTGVLAIFGSRLLNGRPPLVFEDGRQQRDFVHVSDVAEACRLALDSERGAGQVFNIGSGRPRSILSLAEDLAEAMDRDGIKPQVTRSYRAGDIRHCFADISRSRHVLGFEPRKDFRAGLAEFAEWLSHQEAEDRVEQAAAELKQRGLVVA
jgi:dTDP-L-rhamnose 4-epimerase